ncbi:protein FAR1-RELATED SEQUENCE 3 [Sesamum alatum]|uniref:Protein FAR1-RELATED SEQUENCE 3 n=1 Tax=Sesamum alatum TaxID=300844 RepID=A0AAE1XYP4_9LAMI|nr:protein FAR1-RELATED SEQUENCE 3 [Sesamum alatum]
MTSQLLAHTAPLVSDSGHSASSKSAAATPDSPPPPPELVVAQILMDYEIDVDVNGEVVGSSTNFEGRTVDDDDDDDAVVGSSADGMLQHGLGVKVDDDSSERELFRLDELHDANCSAPIDEPYVGQEFESEAAAHAFYNSYATRVGFVIRVSKLSRSRRDGSAIGRALVCNKEGFRMPDKREKIVRQRAETRVGCRAMILVRKVSSGKWVVTKFVKEHTHPLTPGKGRKDLIYDQYPNEHDKIRELSQQLAIEKKKVATYKRHLEMIFEHIEEHNQSLAKKIQNIVNSVREMESKEQLGSRTVDIFRSSQ